MQTRRISGDDLGAGLNREIARTGAVVQELGDTVYKSEERRETTEAAVQLSEAHAQFTNDLNKQLQEGTIDSEQFMQSYDERMGELSGNFATVGGQDYFQKASTSLRSNFQVSTMQAQAEIAGTKAIVGYQQTQKNLTSGIMNDPSSYNVALQMSHDYLDTLVKQGLPAKEAEKLKSMSQTELAKSAVRGWANLDPEDAKAQLDQGLWDQSFDGDVKKQMQGEISTAINAKRIEQERIKAELEKAKVEGQKVTQNDFLAKMAKGKLSTKDILNSNLEPFGSGSKQQFMNMIEESTKGASIKMDPSTFTNLFQRIHLPDGDPNKLINENELNQFLNKGLTLENINQLRGEMQGKNTQAGDVESRMKNQLMEIAKQKLSKTNLAIGRKDPDGELQYAKFLQHFQEQYDSGRKSGKSAISLLSPESPDYLGKSISTFTKTPAQILRGTINSFRPSKAVDPAKARKEGESPADYLKRMKGEAK